MFLIIINTAIARSLGTLKETTDFPNNNYLSNKRKKKEQGQKTKQKLSILYKTIPTLPQIQ